MRSTRNKKTKKKMIKNEKKIARGMGSGGGETKKKMFNSLYNYLHFSRLFSQYVQYYRNDNIYCIYNNGRAVPSHGFFQKLKKKNGRRRNRRTSRDSSYPDVFKKIINNKNNKILHSTRREICLV